MAVAVDEDHATFPQFPTGARINQDTSEKHLLSRAPDSLPTVFLLDESVGRFLRQERLVGQPSRGARHRRHDGRTLTRRPSHTGTLWHFSRAHLGVIRLVHATATQPRAGNFFTRAQSRMYDDGLSEKRPFQISRRGGVNGRTKAMLPRTKIFLFGPPPVYTPPPHFSSLPSSARADAQSVLSVPKKMNRKAPFFFFSFFPYPILSLIEARNRRRRSPCRPRSPISRYLIRSMTFPNLG